MHEQFTLNLLFFAVLRNVGVVHGAQENASIQEIDQTQLQATKMELKNWHESVA